MSVLSTEREDMRIQVFSIHAFISNPNRASLGDPHYYAIEDEKGHGS
jgi:hypothetical protein